MPPIDNPNGPPLATAAHARARTARLLGQLRRSWWLKIPLICGVLLVIAAAPMLFGHAPLGWLGWTRLAFSVSVFALLARIVYLLTSETLWLLRNRLILAYVFMGVVPVVLIAAMLAIGAYMFYGAYAVFLLTGDLNTRTRNVAAVNALTIQELSRHPERAGDGPALSNYYASYYFPRGYGGVHSFFFDRNWQPQTPASERFGEPNTWLSDGFRGLVARPNGYAIASYGTSAGPQGEHVLTLYELGLHNLDTLGQELGHITVGASGFVSLGSSTAATAPDPAARPPEISSSTPLPPAESIFDIRITTVAFLPVTDWATGQQRTVVADIQTRPALLDNLLFASLPSNNSEQAGRWPLLLLATIAVGFLIIEAFSLVAGIRLTRSVTGAVNDLYIGTEHVNRGDFEHRIPVRTRDQLAALEISFNNMTASIGRLLQEQRQKQRLESELSIAHEVQTQLFPHTPPRMAGMEILGRCLPARVVSGDYYDFAPLSPTRLSLMLGDISGKGISSALLMATIVAAVRAYQPGMVDTALGADAAGGGDGRGRTEDTDPARLMRRLNRQLYESTPPEKYATMFYAIYDAERRELRYTNAGHLPPAVIGARGVRRLERGGTVVGLFENVAFDDGVAELESGDLIAVWSDGITEPENEYGVDFGEPRLLQLLERHRSRPLNEIMGTVLAAVHDWCGAQPQADDITLVLARVV